MDINVNEKEKRNSFQSSFSLQKNRKHNKERNTITTDKYDMNK